MLLITPKKKIRRNLMRPGNIICKNTRPRWAIRPVSDYFGQFRPAPTIKGAIFRSFIGPQRIYQDIISPTKYYFPYLIIATRIMVTYESCYALWFLSGSATISRAYEGTTFASTANPFICNAYTWYRDICGVAVKIAKCLVTFIGHLL